VTEKKQPRAGAPWLVDTKTDYLNREQAHYDKEQSPNRRTGCG
jgi:hypothetical protein